MVNDKEIIEVTNKISGTVVYAIPERNNLVRTFRAGETKKVEMEELRQLSYIPGGSAMLENYLTIHNEEAIKELLGQVEPEYFYTEQDLLTLLEKGTIAQMEDFFNFAPIGSKEQLQDLAVRTKLNDMNKREMIKEKLGFDVTNAIKLLEDDIPKPTEDKKARQAAPVTEETFKRQSEPVTSDRKYNVVG